MCNGDIKVILVFCYVISCQWKESSLLACKSVGKDVRRQCLTLSAAAFLSLLPPQDCRGVDCVNAPCLESVAELPEPPLERAEGSSFGAPCSAA